MSQLQNSLAGILPPGALAGLGGGGGPPGALMGLPPGMNLEALRGMMEVRRVASRARTAFWCG